MFGSMVGRFRCRHHIDADYIRIAGESEYWFALIKVLMVIVFIFVGLIFDWGGVKGHPGPVSLPFISCKN